MLTKKVMGAGGFGAASAVSSFSSPVNTGYIWTDVGALTDNYFFLPSFEAPISSPIDYPVYAIDISTGSPGTVTRVFDKSISSQQIDYITGITRMVPLTLRNGEEATAGVFNYYNNGFRTGLFVASPVVSNTSDQFMGVIVGNATFDTRYTLCSAGTWVAYYSHGLDSITAEEYRSDGTNVEKVNGSTKTITGIATTNAVSLAIDSTATYAYLSRYNGSAYVTEVYDFSSGSLLGSYTWAVSIAGTQQSYYDSGNLYIANTTASYLLDVSTPASITLSSSVSYTNFGRVPTLHNGRAYLPYIFNSCSYEVFNIATSSSEGVVPTPADDGYGYSPSDAHPAEVRGDYVFTWAWTDGPYGGTNIFDVSDLNDITYVNTIAPAARVEGVAVSSDGNTLYQIEYDTTQATLTLAKYDVSTKSSPSLLGRSVDLVANYSTFTYFVSKPVLKGNYLYASFKTGSISTDKLISFDVSGNTPTVADDLNCPTTNCFGCNTLAYGDSVFVLGPNSIWDVNVSNPAAMSSAAYRAANQGSGGGAYTGLIDGDYFYAVRPANQFSGYAVYFVIYDLSGHTPGSSFTTAGYFRLNNVDTANFSAPEVWAINKIGDEIFATVPTSYTEAPWMLRVDVSNVSSPTQVLANGAQYTYSGYSNSDSAMCFLLHPDNQTITSFARRGLGAATWNAVTGVATRPVIDVGTYGPSPISFFNSTKHVTLSPSGAMTIGDI